MLGHSHVVIGCAAVVALETLARVPGQTMLPLPGIALGPLTVSGLGIILGGAALGSLLPDIDHPGSALANYRIGGIRPIKPAAAVAHVLLAHRGPTHSLLVWALVTGLMQGLTAGTAWREPAMAASFGYLLHLVADSLTRHGVPWLWPLTNHASGFPPIAWLRFSTGGRREQLVVLAVLILTGVVLAQHGGPLVAV